MVIPQEMQTDYHPNGKLYAVKNYIHSDNPLLIQCRDSIGAVLAENGNGKWLILTDDFETILREGVVKDGVMQSDLLAKIHGKPGMTTIIANTSENVDGLKVDVLPTYNTDPKAFGNFLMNTVRYPVIDRENNTQGRVVLGFTVEEDGKLTNFKILKGISKTMDAEALRVMKLSSPWIPAKIGDKSVKVNFTSSINFTLAED